MSEETENTFPWTVLSPETNWVQRTILLYGPSGSGKTYLAAQFPDPLILGCDPGVLGGAMSAIKFGVKHLKVTNYQEMMNVLPTLKANAGVEFKTIIVDSITFFGKLCLKNILERVGREKPQFDEWGLNYARVANFINNICEMKCHVVFTAIDKLNKDEVTGKIMGEPMLPGQLAKELPQSVDVCARLFTVTGYDNSGKLKVTYKYRTVPDDLYFAKDRSQLLKAEGELQSQGLPEDWKSLFKPEEFNTSAVAE